MAAVVFITSKPVDAFVRGRWEEGFKFLPVNYDSKFEDYYLPATLETNVSQSDQARRAGLDHRGADGARRVQLAAPFEPLSTRRALRRLPVLASRPLAGAR